MLSPKASLALKPNRLLWCSRPRSRYNKICTKLPYLHSASFSFSPNATSYHDTLQHLNIGSSTRVMFQGFTGRQAWSSMPSARKSMLMTLVRRRTTPGSPSNMAPRSLEASRRANTESTLGCLSFLPCVL